MSYLTANSDSPGRICTEYRQRMGIHLVSCGEMHCYNETFLENMGEEPDARIFFVLSGKGAIHRKKQMQSIQEGKAFLIFPEDRRVCRAIILEPWHLVWMDVGGELCTPLLENLGFEGSMSAVPVEQTILHMAQQMVDGVNRIGNGTLAQELRRTGLFMNFLSWMEYSKNKISEVKEKAPPEEELSEENGDGYRHVKYLENYFRENYKQRIRMSDIAEEMGISSYYLCHIFQKYKGMSPSKCLSEIRIARAMKLLEETDMPVGKISEECGYPNALNFSKLFSRMNGCSPSNYRKMQRAAPVNARRNE